MQTSGSSFNNASATANNARTHKNLCAAPKYNRNMLLPGLNPSTRDMSRLRNNVRRKEADPPYNAATPK